MLDPNYCGYIGDSTHDRRRVRDVPLGDAKEAVNAFIAEHRDADRVVISIGTSEIAHVLFIMERGKIVRAPDHNSMYAGIGTPELLAAQECARQQDEIDEERRVAELEEQAAWEAMSPWEQDGATRRAEIYRDRLAEF